MGGSSIFVKYGLKSGGGPSFLKRTRTAFGQLQTRVRSGSTGTQCYWSFTGNDEPGFNTTRDCCGSSPCDCNSAPMSFAACCVQLSFPSINNGQPFWNCNNWFKDFQTVCNFGAFSDWTNTSSCTPTSTCGSNGNRQCQTFYSFREQDWSAYEEVDVCVVANPTAALNAVQVECIAN
jgi:hypothetical protein